MFQERQNFVICLLVTVVVILMLDRILKAHNIHLLKAVDVRIKEEPGRGYLLPSDNIIHGMNTDELTIAYWRYVNTLQILCYEQQRFGSLSDGGKEVCIDDAYRPKQPCIVYSFGSAFRFDFEEAIYRDFKCEIHTYDPSKKLTDKVKIPQGVTFHLVGLNGGQKSHPLNWTMASFSSILNSLGHENRTIDIVKMDIEESEWEAIDHMITSGSIYNVKQLCIEWHLGSKANDFMRGATTKWAYYLEILKRLYEAGFYMFMHERGLHHTLNFKYPFPKYTSLIEISYLNKRFYPTSKQ